ncbi:MAG: peptidase, partial [Bdellovibrionota bacterium]
MMFNKKQFFSVILTLVWTMTACAHVTTGAESSFVERGLTATQRLSEGVLIRSDYAPGEITALCKAAVDQASVNLDAIAKIKADTATVQNTLLAFENTLADLNDMTNGLTFMGYVSLDEKLRAEGSACEEGLGQFYVGLFTRKDIYAALQLVKPTAADEVRLSSETLKAFEKNGLKLPDAELAQLKTLLSEISRNETKFSANLNNDVTTVNFAASELKGVPESFLARAKKSTGGEYIITTKSSDYTVIMENA